MFILFKFSLLLLGIVTLVQADFSVETSNNAFIPSTELRSAYNEKVSSQVGGYHKAEVYFKTTVPSLNPDQSGVVSNLECENDKITLSLTDNNAMEQVKDWPNKVLLLISHKWQCFGKATTQFYMIGNKTVDEPNRKVSFTKEDCNLLDWSEEFVVDVSWENGEITKPNTRRNLNQRNRLNRRQKQREFNKRLDLNLLFDEKTGKSSKPDFPIIELESNSLLCSNCFVKGEATVSMRVAYKFLPIVKLTEAKISINGNLQMNFDLAVKGKFGTSVSSPELQLLNVPLTPLGVPNLFNIGPAIILGTSAEVSADVTGTLHTGTEINLPNFNITATIVDEPKVEQSGFDPKTESHEPKVDGIVYSVGITGSLKPRLSLGLDVLNGLFSVQTGIQLVTTLGTKASFGKENGCEEKPHIQTTLGGNVGLFLQTKSVPVVEFPSLNLSDQCL